MANITTVDSWKIDPRRFRLIEKTGRVVVADGVMMAAWNLAQEYWKERRLIPYDKFMTLDSAQEILDCGLAIIEDNTVERQIASQVPYETQQTELDQFVYVRGTVEHMDWLAKRRLAGQTGGQKSGVSRRKKAEENVTEFYSYETSRAKISAASNLGPNEANASKLKQTEANPSKPKQNEPSYSYSYSSSLNSSSSLSSSFLVAPEKKKEEEPLLADARRGQLIIVDPVRHETDQTELSFEEPPASKPPVTVPSARKELNRRIWESYSEAYKKRYGILPIRNAQVNAQIKKLGERFGQEAIQIAAFYLTHNKSFYVANTHDLRFLVNDAATLRTQWRCGRAITDDRLWAVQKRVALANMHQAIDDGEV